MQAAPMSNGPNVVWASARARDASNDDVAGDTTMSTVPKASVGWQLLQQVARNADLRSCLVPNPTSLSTSATQLLGVTECGTPGLRGVLQLPLVLSEASQPHATHF